MTSPYGALSDELEGLIERVAKATGPDRALDLALATALVPDVLVMRQRDDNSGADPYTYWRYTEKIDDALALVERLKPGYRWGVSCAPIKDGAYPDGKTKYADGFKAHVTKSSPLRPMPAIGEARTPALAILLAALRSLQTGNAE